MDIEKATYDVLSDVIQTSYGKSSEVKTKNPPTHFLTMKVKSWLNPHVKDEGPWVIINVTIIVSHPDVESLRLSLREEALELSRKAVQNTIQDYKTEVKKRKAVATATKQNYISPPEDIKLELNGNSIYDDFVYISANMKSHCKTAYYRFEVKARIV
jgi:hypothetical protein